MSIRFGRSGNGYDSSQVMQTPDDDWRQITDVAERRRIQNRLAQRNYRRKLRQRLEELERQAGDIPSTVQATSRKRTSRSPEYASKRAHRDDISRQSRAGTEEEVIDIPRTEQYSQSPVFATAIPQASAQSSKNDNGMDAADSHSFYAGDFGPLLSAREIRSCRAAAGTPPLRQGWDNIWDGSNRLQSELRDIFLQSSPDASSAGTSHSISRDSSSPLSGSDIYVATALDIAFPPPPAVSSSYSASPLINPDPLHLNPPLIRDDFYITLAHSQMVRATMAVGKILKVEESEMMDDDTISKINQESQWSVPEDCEDLQPTQRQLTVPHHPYIDTIPFRGFRDRLIECTEHAVKTGDDSLEQRVCDRMCESFHVWGESPWDARSWEVSEDFAREFWFFIDNEMVRSTNFWRRQRGLKSLNIPALKRGMHAAAAERGRIIGEVRG